MIARYEPGDLFEITSVRPDGAARISVTCVQLGLQNQDNS
jgi:hypothetical protein